jgi:(E)-4-hydroxy-3-methylbut-2-enyl-diphosphate synthase
MTRSIRLGNLTVGGGSPISIQSMTKTDTRDRKSTIAQIEELAKIGCQIIRVAVPDEEAAEALFDIKRRCPIPLVADIHFNFRLALRAVEAGVDGLRINPGNISGKQKIAEIVSAAKDHGIPIRIGVNSGSLEKSLLEKFGEASAEAMVESALSQVHLLEKMGFSAIKISLKASDVPRTVRAYRLLSEECDYPLHLGITESGTIASGTVKSAVGLGILLAEGIGDTIRVSLTAPPHEEVKVASKILKSLELTEGGVDLVSCPTCGRCQIDVIDLAQKVEDALADIRASIRVAVMGCAVNGPGEAGDADLGLAGGKREGLLFKGGEVLRKVKEKEFFSVLVAEARKMAEEKTDKVKIS